MTAAALKDFGIDRNHWAGLQVQHPGVSARPTQIVPDTDLARPVMTTDLSWLSRAYSLAASGSIDAAVDLVFDRFDALLATGSFRRADEALAAVDVKRLDTHLMVALLSITLPGRAELRRRAALVKRIERELEQTAPTRADELLAGLR